MKKKLAVLLSLILIIGLSAIGVTSREKAYAKEAQMYLEIAETVKKENEFTVKVILNSDVELYSIDAYLSYNAELLEFVPDNEKVTGAAGVLELRDTYKEETKNAVYEITFKALETGEAEIALTEVFLIDYADLDYIEVVPSAKHFEIGINKKVAADARLSELILAPGELTESFLPDKLEYEMHVGMDVEMIGVSAIPMEEGSIVELDMPEKLLPGENLVVVTVTALSGNVNTYMIKVYREEQDDILEDTVTEDTEADTISDTEDQISTEAATEITTEELTTEIDKTTETVNPEIPVEENSTEE
ncbi:MAG: hypothetical protein K2J90_12925 [Lachnospiraceae bacterium]|nr:hypothetical protein [Lachnospiraceae bacterium]